MAQGSGAQILLPERMASLRFLGHTCYLRTWCFLFLFRFVFLYKSISFILLISIMGTLRVHIPNITFVLFTLVYNLTGKMGRGGGMAQGEEGLVTSQVQADSCSYERGMGRKVVSGLAPTAFCCRIIIHTLLAAQDGDHACMHPSRAGEERKAVDCQKRGTGWPTVL